VSRDVDAIVIQGLTKLYGSRVGCQDVDLEVPAGRVFGFLGPNGAGKSTLVKMLVGLIRPTRGKAWIMGRPLDDVRVRRRIGYLPENFRYQDWLTGTELLSFHAALCGVRPAQRKQRVTEALDLVGLAGRGHQRLRAYSKGMQQRIGVACALIGNPDLIFLDEPTSALDPLGRREMRQLILDLRGQGKTVFLNSHLLGEVEAVCERVAIIDKGRIVAQGSLGELLAPRVEVEMDIEGLTPELEDALTCQATASRREGARLVMTMASHDEIPGLAETVIAHGARLHSLIPRQRSLEELFVDVVRSGPNRSAGPNRA